MKNIQGDAYRLALRGRHTGGKHVLINDTAACIARSGYAGKRYLPRFPEEGKCQGASRDPKANNVSWNVVRLDNIMCVVIIKVSPTTKLNVQLAALPRCANAVPGDKSQNSRRFEMRNIGHLEPVCSVSQAARELQLCRRPLFRDSRDAQMQCAALVRPDVRWIEEIYRAGAEDWSGARCPLVSTEVQCLGRGKYRRCATTVSDCHCHNAVADRRQRFGLLRRIVGRINQQSSILQSQVDRIFPPPICFNVCKLLIRPRVQAPSSISLGVQHDSLLGSSSFDA